MQHSSSNHQPPPSLSSSPLAVQSLFYACGLKAEVFGIANLGAKRQVNYVWGELDAPDVRGSDVVVSLLLDYLRSHSHQRHIYLMADNCCGQNKNWGMLRFLAMYSIVFQADIYLHFPIAGHTKGMHDAGFGLLKRHMQKHDVVTPGQLMTIIDESSTYNNAKDATRVKQQQHSDHLSRFFLSLSRAVAITKQHHFCFKASEPGILHYRQYVTHPEWKRKTFLRPEVDPTALDERVFEQAPELPRLVPTEKRKEQLRHVRDKILIGRHEQHRREYTPRDGPTQNPMMDVQGPATASDSLAPAPN